MGNEKSILRNELLDRRTLPDRYLLLAICHLLCNLSCQNNLDANLENFHPIKLLTQIKILKAITTWTSTNLPPQSNTMLWNSKSQFTIQTYVNIWIFTAYCFQVQAKIKSDGLKTFLDHFQRKMIFFSTGLPQKMKTMSNKFVILTKNLTSSNPFFHCIHYIGFFSKQIPPW